MAENNVIKKADIDKSRSIDFTLRFEESIQNLLQVIGVSRAIPVEAGTTLNAYITDGALESGEVAEGDLIPLSKLQVKKVPMGEAKLNKWRKATTAEAILKSGYDTAVGDTSDKMIKLVQKDIRADYFKALAKGTQPAGGSTLQPALANAWGILGILFDDTAVETVYFLNPMDVSKYLGNAQISTQTAFGMKYVKDFLGLGDAILAANVPQGTFYATAKENIVLYYVSTNSANGLGNAFDFITDETGFVGIHEQPDYAHMTAETVVVSGVDIFAERIDGVVVGEIGGEEQTPAEA